MAILLYDIKVVGKDSVDKALAGIEARLRQHNTNVSRIAGGGAGGSSSRVSAGAARAHVDTSARGAQRELEKKAREELRLKNAVNAVNVRGAQGEQRTKERSIREEYRLRNQLNNLNLREVRKEERLRAQMGTRDQRMAMRHAKERSEFVQSTLGHGVDRVSRTTRAVGATGSALLGVGGAGLAATAVAGATRLDEQVRRIIIGARGAGEKAAIDPNELRKKIGQTSVETGVNDEAIAGGTAEFVSKTGNIDVAMKSMKMLATFSQATGADMKELAGITASMFNNGITSTADMAQALATLTFQGKKASFELKDMAQFMPSVMAKGRKLGMTGVEGAQQVGSLLQIAQMGTQNSAESATSVERMMDAFVSKGSKFESGEMFNGNAVKIFTDSKRTKMRNPLEVIPEMMAASQGNISQLFDSMDIRGSRALDPIVARYNETAAGTKGTQKEKTAAGVAAVKAMLSEFKDVSGTYTDIQKDAGDAMKSFSVQMDVVETKFKQAMAEQLMPELMRLGPELGKLVPYVGRATKLFVELVSFFMNHPFQVVATVVAMQLAADFAKARLGSVVSGLIEKTFMKLRLPTAGATGGAGGAGIGGGGAASTGSFLNLNPSKQSAVGAMGAAATGAALGLTIGSAIITANVVNFEAGEANMKSSGELLNQIREMTSPDQAKEARKLVEQQQGVVNSTKKSGIFESIASTVMPDGWAHSLAQTVGTASSDTEVKTQESFLKEMQDRLQKLELLQDMAKKLEAAGVSQESAAKELSEAAKRLGLSTPNRGNTPSPVKT